MAKKRRRGRKRLNFISSQDRIMGDPNLRRCIIAHERVVREDGTVDYESGEERNPPEIRHQAATYTK